MSAMSDGGVRLGIPGGRDQDSHTLMVATAVADSYDSGSVAQYALRQIPYKHGDVMQCRKAMQGIRALLSAKNLEGTALQGVLLPARWLEVAKPEKFRQSRARQLQAQTDAQQINFVEAASDGSGPQTRAASRSGSSAPGTIPPLLDETDNSEYDTYSSEANKRNVQVFNILITYPGVLDTELTDYLEFSQPDLDDATLLS